MAPETRRTHGRAPAEKTGAALARADGTPMPMPIAGVHARRGACARATPVPLLAPMLVPVPVAVASVALAAAAAAAASTTDGLRSGHRVRARRSALATRTPRVPCTTQGGIERRQGGSIEPDTASSHETLGTARVAARPLPQRRWEQLTIWRARSAKDHLRRGLSLPLRAINERGD